MPNTAVATMSARVHGRCDGWPGHHRRHVQASSTIAAKETRNHATATGRTSSNRDLARIDPMFCDRPARTKIASGEKNGCRAAGAVRVTETAGRCSVEQLWIGAADLLPERREAEPPGQRITGQL